jgi:hypothetical protein
LSSVDPAGDFVARQKALGLFIHKVPHIDSLKNEHRHVNITNELTPISRCSERDAMPIEISTLGQISRAQFVDYEHTST